MYMKFQKLLMTGCRDMDKKHQKYPKNVVFPPFVTPQDFFQKSGSVTFVPLWCTNFMQKFRKILRAVFEIFKDGRTTDYGRTTDMGDFIGPSRVNPGSKKFFTPSPKVFEKKIIVRRHSTGTQNTENVFWPTNGSKEYSLLCVGQ